MNWEKVPDTLMAFYEGEPWKKFYGNTPRHIEYPLIPVDGLLAQTAKEFPESSALFFMGSSMSYQELEKRVNEFATGLTKVGIGKGDVVMIDLPNIPQFQIAFFAIMKIGGIANPVIPLNRYAEIVHQSNDSKAKAMIILDSLYDEYLDGKDLSKMESLETIVMTGLAEYLSPIKGKLGKILGKIPYMKKWPDKVGDVTFTPFQKVLESGIGENPAVNQSCDPQEDVACLIYTGGTTGTPKGVQLTHFNLVANCMQCKNMAITQVDGVTETFGNGGMVAVLPLSHSFGLTIAMLLGTTLGYEIIHFPRPPDKISELLKEAAKRNAVFAPGVPTLWNRLNQDPASEKHAKKLMQFRACLSGAAPLPFEVKEKFENMTGAKITEGYGMSECSPLLTGGPFGRPRPNSVGLPAADTYLKIVDADVGNTILPQCPHTEPYCTEKCGPDEAKYIGEICGCGPQVMKGYLNKPEETKKVLRKDEDGVTWYYTSDIGCIDSEGYLRIKDRKRDMIKYKGHSVFPREIEDLLYQYEPINEVGVYGVPSSDPETGEEIRATISLKPECKGKVSVKDITAWCKENMAWYKYPRKIEIVEELPKSIVGKVLRRVLRDEAAEKAAEKQEE